MEIKVLDAREIGATLGALMDKYQEYYWAVAWGGWSDLAEKLVNGQHKVKKIIIGTHFFQTSPYLLHRIQSCSRARVQDQSGSGVFHPKIYFFRTGRKAAAIVGSANFTKAGTSDNVETAIFLEGGAGEPELLDIRRRVDDLWKQGRKIDTAFLSDYSRKHEAKKRHLRTLEESARTRLKPNLKAAHPDLLNWSWKKYLEEIRNAQGAELKNGVAVLDRAHELFMSVSRFSDLEKEERYAVAACLKAKEKPGDWGQDRWGQFGTLSGFGIMRAVLQNKADKISDALSCIPLSGEITKKHYDEYIEHFVEAFCGEKRNPRVASASRLLAMKRPDYFICVNTENISALAKDLAFRRNELEAQGAEWPDYYWDNVVAPLTEANWWQAARPDGKDGKAWDGRIALLDNLYRRKRS